MRDSVGRDIGQNSVYRDFRRLLCYGLRIFHPVLGLFTPAMCIICVIIAVLGQFCINPHCGLPLFKGRKLSESVGAIFHKIWPFVASFWAIFCKKAKIAKANQILLNDLLGFPTNS